MDKGDIDTSTKANTDDTFDVEESISRPFLRYQDQTPTTPIKPLKTRASSAVSLILDDETDLMQSIENAIQKCIAKNIPTIISQLSFKKRSKETLKR